MPGANCSTTLNDTPPPHNGFWRTVRRCFCTHHSCETSEEKRSSWSWDPCVCVDPCELSNVGLQTRTHCTHTQTHTHFTNVVCWLQWRHKSHRSDFTEAISSSSGTCGWSSSSAYSAGLCRAWDDDCLNSEHAAVPTRWAALSRPEMCSSITQQIVI